MQKGIICLFPEEIDWRLEMSVSSKGWSVPLGVEAALLALLQTPVGAEPLFQHHRE